MPKNIHKRPSARRIQPIALRGRLEAIRAPTSGKIRKITPPKRSPTVRFASQLLGMCAERASTSNGTLATNMATERPASDQASKKAARAPPSPGFVPSPLPSQRYSTVQPSPSCYGKRYEVHLCTPRVDQVVEGFDRTKDILIVWTSSTN